MKHAATSVFFLLPLAFAACADPASTPKPAASAPNQAAPPAATPGPANDAGMVERTGRLRGGIMGIGGEHTGWILQPPGDDAKPIEVDVSRIAADAAALDSMSVTIRGMLTQKKTVERGERTILIADSIKPAP